jgi:1-acyl-sn-glycerol-3-phosphate acyltransferase
LTPSTPSQPIRPETNCSENRPKPPHLSAWRWALLRLFRTDVQITSQADLISNQPCIVVCNHQSLLDGVLFALAAPTALDYAVTPRYAVQNGTTRRGLAFLSRCGLGRVIPLSASHALSLRSLRKSLIDGNSVMIFPTGTISAAEEQRGFIWLHEQTGCPIIRASISGADRWRFFSTTGRQFWPKITITI